ncbi:MAG: 16S rRNA (guanine(966)-N(2))-methyltransferase RsmD [Alphaproteobacteria bacterium]|nr:16S rRNA (guanine(966)-N(2))-methyltransferase RsmD [Alphaproteobacteria bacterium]
MRIISGKHRGRRIAMHDDADIRPTSGRTREAIFNILVHGSFGRDGESPLIGKRIIDIFCGTGGLGLEALSRGASHVTFVDRNTQSLKLARENVEHFHETENTSFIRSDSTQLPPAAYPCTVAFADPPYNKGLAAPALQSLKQSGWLEPDALVVLELSSHELLHVPEGFDQIDERVYGNSKVLILRNA